MDRTEKAAMAEHLKGVFAQAGAVVVTHYSGLTVAQMSDLRRQVSAEGGQYKVTKNRVAKIALEGTPYASIADLFTGPVGIAYSDDPIAAAKVTVKFAKTNDKLVIIGGGMGDTRLDANGVKALAELPSLDELRGKLIGLLQAPATKVAGVIQAPAGGLARVIQAYASKDAA